ncbi:hypothetical protein SPHV1_480022 [Novosphingobium sp. KN65.2]|nr:hypothetical protein SPHV1_480022 [Novosphingobium sp. KN65.2]
MNFVFAAAVALSVIFVIYYFHTGDRQRKEPEHDHARIDQMDQPVRRLLALRRGRAGSDEPKAGPRLELGLPGHPVSCDAGLAHEVP